MNFVSDIHKEFHMWQQTDVLLLKVLRFLSSTVKKHDSMHRVDPEGGLVRHVNGIHRRSYSEPSPQSLYHIDGNQTHKVANYCDFQAYP